MENWPSSLTSCTPAEVVNTSLAAAEEPLPGSTQLGAVLSEDGPPSLAAATSPNLSAAPVASSQNTTAKEFMELDSYKESSALTTASSEATDSIALGSLDAAVATNVTTSVAPKAGISSLINTTNIISEHWADIVDSEEALSLQWMNRLAELLYVAHNTENYQWAS
ncbi:hypothetical protein J132_01036 [Termitomyces sp. J132]|nr:hypothetical protein J132_01036 [Termitomyces sp. J132]